MLDSLGIAVLSSEKQASEKNNDEFERRRRESRILSKPMESSVGD